MVWVIVAIAFSHPDGEHAPILALMSKQVRRQDLPRVNGELGFFYDVRDERDGVMFISGMAGNLAEAQGQLRRLVEMGFYPAGREVPNTIRRIRAPHQAF